MLAHNVSMSEECGLYLEISLTRSIEESGARTDNCSMEFEHFVPTRHDKVRIFPGRLEPG